MKKLTKKQRNKIYLSGLKEFAERPIFGLCYQLKHYGRISHIQAYRLDKIFPELRMVAPDKWEVQEWFFTFYRGAKLSEIERQDIRLTLFALMIALTD